MTRNALILAAALLWHGLYACACTSAAVVHDEELSGDLSGDYASPSIINLLPGSNVLIGSMGVSNDGEDLEYVNVNVPGGYYLSELRLLQYEGRDLTAFIGLQEGTAFTFQADDAFSHINDMLGWSHIGPGAGTAVGSDLLPAIGENGQGFTPPLAGPTYTFWIQQTGSVTDYQLNFVVTPIPEPATWLILGIAAVFAVARIRMVRFR